MKLQAFDIGTWLFPDSVVTEDRPEISLDVPRNCDVCFQILTDRTVEASTPFSWSSALPEDGLGLQVEQLCPALVSHNSDVKHHDTKNYEEVKDFVIRKAPYEIFDRTQVVTDRLCAGRLAFLVRVDAQADLKPGSYRIPLTLNVGEESATVEIELTVYRSQVKDPKDSPFTMCHWIYPDTIAAVHKVERGSEAYFCFYEKYLTDLYAMRNNYFQLPTAIPVKDEAGKIIEFDFSECERIASIAKRIGFSVIIGGFVSHFKKWDDPDYFLVWDMEIPVESTEGYRQLKLYFNGVKSFIERNGLEGMYMQGLVDEPQVPNSLAYKALCCTFRTFVPGVKIIDPVETPFIPGSCDIWVIKQEVYEKYKEEYDKLAALGEEFMVYSCGFPAGSWMNHVMDLPLSATRLITWQAIAYGMTGFLHYGYHAFHKGQDTMYEANAPIMFRGEMRYFPAGNHGIIYANEERTFDSVRLHVQRMAAAEAELLMRLRRKNRELCDQLVAKLCTDFKTYTTDSSLVESVRKQLLEAVDQLEA